MSDCVSCGKKLDDDSGLCIWCGAAPELRQMIQEAELLIQNGSDERALELIDKVLQRMPDSVKALILKATILQQNSLWQESLTLIDRVKSLDEKNPRVWFLRGNALDAMHPDIPSTRGSDGYKGLEESVRCYEKCVELAPGFALAWFHRALPEERLGRHQDAMRSYRTFLSLNPGPELSGQKSHALMRVESQEIIAVPPASDETSGVSWLGRLANGGMNDALAFFDMVLQVKPDDPKSWVSKGFALEETGCEKEALDHYEKALGMDPKLGEAWMRKGCLFARMGRSVEAMKCYAMSVQLDPDREEPWYHKGLLEQKLGLASDSLASLNKFITLTPPGSRTGQVEDARLRISELGSQAVIPPGKPGKPPGILEKLGSIFSGRSGQKSESTAIKRETIEPGKDLPKPPASTYLTPDKEGASNEKARAGMTLCRQKNYKAALESFEGALALNPRNVNAMLNRGICLSELGRKEEALESFKRTLEVDPRNVPALNNLGDSLSDSGKYEEAIKYYSMAIDIAPGEPIPWSNKGTCLIHLGRYEEAIDCFDNALALDPKDCFSISNKAAALNRMGRYEEALICNDASLAINPSDLVAMYNRGCNLGKLGRYDEAIVAYTKLLALKPQHKAALNNRADALMRTGRLEESLTAYESLIVFAPDFTCAWEGKSEALYMSNRYYETLEASEKALGLNPSSHNALYYRALAFDALGRSGEALSAYERFLSLEPVDNDEAGARIEHAKERKAILTGSRAQFQIDLQGAPGQIPAAGGEPFPGEDVDALIEEGKRLLDLDMNRALALFHRATEIAPADGGGWAGKAQVLQALGKGEEALPCYDMVIRLNPDWAGAWHMKGDCFETMGRLQEAIDCFDRAILIEPSFADAWCDKGHCLNRLDRSEEAITCFDKAIELNPQSYSAWFNKAEQQTRLRRFADAKQSYQRFLAIVPPGNDTLVERARGMILKMESALSQAPADDYDALVERGASLTLNGDLEEADRCFQKAGMLNPYSGRLWLYSGLLEERRGRNEEALKLFERAVMAFEMEFRGHSPPQSILAVISLARAKAGLKAETGDAPSPKAVSGEDEVEQAGEIDDGDYLHTAPLSRKVTHGCFRETGIVLVTNKKEQEASWREIVYVYLGRVEPDASPEDMKKDGAGTSEGKIKPVVRAGRFQPKVASSPYYLLDIYVLGQDAPFRVDPVGTNLRGFLGDDAGFSAEINLFNFVKKLLPAVSEGADESIHQFIEKGKKVIPVHNSRESFSRRSFEGFRKRKP